MIIPPTQEMLIPNTPPRAEGDKEGNVSNGNNTTSSNLDETQIEDIPKDPEKEEDEFMEFGSQNDMTQDISGLVETQQILPSRSEFSKEDNKEPGDDDDDDWQLRFSETQETQELLSTARMREKKEQEESHLPTISEEKVCSSPKKDISSEKEEETAKLESNDPMDISSEKKDGEDESENEIEPSQSFLNDDTYSAFRDQLTQIAQEVQTAHSTPDCTFNGGQTTLKFDSKALPVPSPIGKKPEINQSIVSEPIVSEHEPTTDILSSDSKLLSCDSPVKGESKEESVPILVLDTEPEQLPEISDNAPEITIDVDKAMKETTVVCDTIELMSSVDDTAGEDPQQKVSLALEKPTEETTENVTEHEKESESNNEKELVAIELIAKDKEDTKVAVSEVPSTEEQGASGISSSENGVEEKKIADIPESLPDTIPTAMLPPLTTRLSRKQKFETAKKNLPGAPYEKSEKSAKCSIGTFKDTKSLEKIFNNSYGIFLDHECMDAMLSLKPSEELKVRKVLDFTVRNNRVYLQQSIEVGSPSYLQHHQAISPHSGSSSNTTSSTVSTIKSLHSGEMADISSSSSAKSANSSSVIQFDTTAHSSISSQEHGQITSTQKSEQPSSFGNMFIQKKKDSFEIEEEISPIKKLEEPKSASGRKRGGRKAAPANNKAPPPPPPKRKRGRAAKSSDKAGPSTASSESSSASKDPEAFVEGRTKKSLRRKKNEKEEPPPKAIAVKESSVEEIVASDGNDPYKDSPYGSILPGVRVMARWKDGYYYPGIVQSQELEGRWSVRFDDNDIRAIPQENLIKVYNLEPGTSALVMSPDGFYDPGIICGHYKDSTGSGYEVEMDSGITKRYPRSAVILSNDQAKLLTSSRPPTTPATMTINLDNIIDGKRKRKSIQSPDSNSATKRTRRTSQRFSKVDPNLDSTESATTEIESTSFKRPESTETEEEAITEQRSTRKRKAAKMGAVKITQSLAQSSGKHPKLFKDYAFLLTNAERKPPVTSDTESSEVEEIMPFNKDELVDYILTRGGTILDKFEDIQKCAKKNIFLLANTYLRTMKYIKCLAAGIYCIKHHWVQNCCFKGEILNHSCYNLPAGKSLITNQIVEWHGKSDVLKGLKICLISAPENPFVYTWAPVLLAAKADFVQKWNLPSSKSGGNIHVDVLVTNIHCPSEILQSAKRRKIPIVSSEWVIQSLIAGKCLQYDAHPKFRHDFTE
ncbi:unnamed protein product [Larinioides sclopetarius]